MSTIHSGSSIPELIKFIRYSFRESEFDQVQNILMEKEKIMLIEMEKLAKDRDSLKNEFYLLGNIRRVTVSEKFSLEGKLGGIKKRCEVLEKEISQLKEKIRIVRNEKLVVEKKLEKSLRKCEEREEKFAKMEKEIEDLRGDKLDANLAVEELKRKEIETNGIVLELKLKNAEANRTIDEFESSVCDVDPRILMLETKLAKICDVSVEDLRYLVSRTEDSAAAANVGDEENVENCPMNVDAGDRVAVLPEVRPTCGTSSGDGGIGFVKKGSKGGTVQLGGEVSSSAAVDVVVIESDDEREAADATVTNKRSRTERAEDWSVKKKPSMYLNDFEDVESTDSDDESCPDWDIDKLLETIQSKKRCGK